MTNSLYQLEGVTQSSGGDRRLDDLTFVIEPGITAVIGPSGAGKSSLLNLLVGYERPTAGRINSAAPRVSWSPPDFGLWPHLTVRQHLQAAAHRSEEIEQYLGLFGLNRVADRKAELLSEGERSRLAVARAVAVPAPVVILDEPLVHLDAATRPRLFEQLVDHLRADGRSLIFTTHIPADVLSFADRVVCLDDGRLRYDGAVGDLYHRPPDRDLAALLGAVNWLEPDDSEWLEGPLPGHPCVRPEHLDITRHESSACEVQSVRNIGSEQHVRMQHRRTGEQRTFIRSRGGTALSAGTRCVLRVVAVLFMMASLLTAPGCGDATEARSIADWDAWSLSPVGLQLPAPRGLATDADGRLFVLDDAGRVLVYSHDRKLEKTWTMPEYDIGRPEGIVVLPDGRSAVADTHYHRVVIFDPYGNVVSTFGEKGDGEGQFTYPVAIDINADGHFFVAEYGGNDRVQVFDADGEFLRAFGKLGTGDGEFQRPSGVVCYDGDVYVADAVNHRVQVFSEDGRLIKILNDPTNPLQYPYDLTIDADGNLWLPEWGSGRVAKMSRTGEILAQYGSEGRQQGQFWTPWGIAVDHSGNIYVADTGNQRVVRFDPQ